MMRTRIKFDSWTIYRAQGERVRETELGPVAMLSTVAHLYAAKDSEQGCLGSELATGQRVALPFSLPSRGPAYDPVAKV